MGRLKRAEEIQGRTLTDFVAAAADEAACRAIEQTEIIHLSLEDQRQLADAILNPPEPQCGSPQGRQEVSQNFRRGMTDPPFHLAPPGAEHDRASCDCGEEALDRYFKTQAIQDIRRRVANCFVAVEASGVVAGYYTIPRPASRSSICPWKSPGACRAILRCPRCGSAVWRWIASFKAVAWEKCFCSTPCAGA
jgi:hypothetical protein